MASLTTEEAGRVAGFLASLFPPDLLVEFAAARSRRLTGTISVNFKDGRVLSSDHRPDWPPPVAHREYPRDQEVRRPEHRDLAG